MTEPRFDSQLLPEDLSETAEVIGTLATKRAIIPVRDMLVQGQNGFMSVDRFTGSAHVAWFWLTIDEWKQFNVDQLGSRFKVDPDVLRGEQRRFIPVLADQPYYQHLRSTRKDLI